MTDVFNTVENTDEVLNADDPEKMVHVVRSLRLFSFVDKIFGHDLGDGGGKILDYVIVPVGVMTCILLAVAVGFLWTKKHVSFMRIKSMRFVILQTFGGIMWYLGFVVRFGHFPRIGIFYSCSFWNFYASIVFGFMIWAACIVFRLLRLHLLFNHGINSIKGLSLANQPFTIILLLCIPHLIVYGVFLPLSGAVVRRQVSDGTTIVTAQCLYSSPFWAWTDNILFFSVWALLYVLGRAVANVNDGYREAVNLHRALTLSLYTLACTVVVELLQIDGLAVGRTIVTTSVLASVVIFFLRQNGEELFRLLSGRASSGDLQQDEAIDEAILRQESGGDQTDSLEGGELPDENEGISADTPDLLSGNVRHRGLSTKKKKQLFAETLLKND